MVLVLVGLIFNDTPTAVLSEINQPMTGAMSTPNEVVREVKPIVGAGKLTSAVPELKKILPILAPAIRIPFLNWAVAATEITSKMGIKKQVFFCITVVLGRGQIYRCSGTLSG